MQRKKISATFHLPKLRHDHPYLSKNHGFDLETIKEFGLGYFTGNHGSMASQIIIPIHDAKGKLVAYAEQNSDKQLNPENWKYKLAGGFKRSQGLFNLHRTLKEVTSKPLIIVNGFFDTMWLYQNDYRNVVALMNSSMSQAQEELIRRYVNPQTQILLMFHEDQTGRIARENVAARLSKVCYTKVHTFDKPNMRPEDLTVSEINSLF
jgi:DNA primase